MWYNVLRKLELLRYLGIVCIVQIPMLVLVVWIGIRFWLWLQTYSDSSIAEIIVFMTHLPYPFLAWGMIVVVLTLIIPSNIFNIKQQYLIHLQHKFLIEYAEDKRISVLDVKSKVKEGHHKESGKV